MARRKWTPEEEALLGTMPDGELAVRLGRTHEGVKRHRADVGKPPCPAANKWTPEEDDKLRVLYGRLPVKTVAERLKRSVQSIHTRASRLSIKPQLDRFAFCRWCGCPFYRHSQCPSKNCSPECSVKCKDFLWWQENSHKRQYTAEERDERFARLKKWREDNPEAYMESCRRYRSNTEKIRRIHAQSVRRVKERKLIKIQQELEAILATTDEHSHPDSGP